MKNKLADIAYGGLNSEKIHSAITEVNLDNLRHLYNFITERYKIHLRKDIEGLPKPWTDNPILRDYKFTNIRREHDRTTKYLLEKLEEHKYDTLYNKYTNIILFRLFNKIETYELLDGWINFEDPNPAEIKRKLQAAPKGFVFFTNAFYTTGMRQGIAKYSNIEFEPLRVIKTVYRFAAPLYAYICAARNPREVCTAMEQINGIGPFLSYQMFVDMTYLPEFRWSENEFVIAGPGCVRGLRQIYTNWAGLTANELLFQLRDNINALFKVYIDPNWDTRNLMTDLPEYDRKLNIMSLENCMCEISKYIRAVEGSGRPKNKYNGG